MGFKSIVTAITVLMTMMFFLTAAPYVMGKTVDKQTQTILTKKIDINTADVKTLTLVKGIGEKKARSIIDYRKKHGSFKKVDELINIKGIGEKNLKKFKKHLKVS